MVGVDRGDQLVHQCLLRVVLLLGDAFISQHVGIALQVHARVGDQRFVLTFLGHSLRQYCVERVGVNLRQQVALMHVLPLGESNLINLPVHPGAHGDGVERLHVADAGQIDRHILLGDGAGDDRDGRQLH